ncbi:MAG TPA: hypothetical protein PK358_03735 [Spirochaetota bacterium]|nr:hypothetical protein [Spirochaetota bacterium]HPJ33918.1 hypothetical protein [Spirochaetota bacterium]
MKIKIFLISLFMLISASGVMAYDWSSAGMQLKESGTAEDENFLILSDSSANEIKVRFVGELDDKWGEAVVKLNKQFRTWQYMKVAKLEFFVNGNTLEILVIPSSFTYSGLNFMPHIPAGLTFLYDYDLRYNFRVTKNDFFLRINDRFINEKFLCQRMKEAVDDPVAYMKKREPEYFLRKLNELEEAQARTEKVSKDNFEKLTRALLYYQNTGFLGFGNTSVKPQVIKRVIELKAATPAITKEKIKTQLDSEKIKVTDKEIQLILDIFYNEFDEK